MDAFQLALTKNVIVVALCISINYINGTTVITFLWHQVFSENPRYILFIHMVRNDKTQLTVSVTMHVISHIFFAINVSLCCFLITIAMFSTTSNPLNLASMAIECFVAICHPLHHSQICTVRRTYILIGLIWVLGTILVMPDILVVLATELPEFFHSSILCIQDNVFRHPYLRQKKDVSCAVPLITASRTMNSTAFDVQYKNSTQVLVRDSFGAAFAKNFVVVFVWFSLSCVNASVIITFFRHQVFYQDPRYILFIHMVISDAIQLTVTVTLFLLSYIVYTINVSFCCFFILVAVFTTRSTPINLAGMAVERYIAICNPLRHSQICTVRWTYMLISLIWFLCVAPDIADLFVTLATESITFFQTSVFCLRQNVFRDPTLSFRRQAFDALYFSLVFLTLFYTYLRVLFAAKALSTEKASAQKARKTILLHGVQLLMCLLSYISSSVELVISMILPGHISEIRYATYLIVFILPRFLSPIIYGVRDKTFQKCLKRDFICSKYTVKRGNAPHIRTLESVN
ncbi:Olfactory receptor 51D1-like [Arapaima gigas]